MTSTFLLAALFFMVFLRLSLWPPLKSTIISSLKLSNPLQSSEIKTLQLEFRSTCSGLKSTKMVLGLQDLSTYWTLLTWFPFFLHPGTIGWPNMDWVFWQWLKSLPTFSAFRQTTMIRELIWLFWDWWKKQTHHILPFLTALTTISLNSTIVCLSMLTGHSRAISLKTRDAMKLVHELITFCTISSQQREMRLWPEMKPHNWSYQPRGCWMKIKKNLARFLCLFKPTMSTPQCQQTSFSVWLFKLWASQLSLRICLKTSSVWYTILWTWLSMRLKQCPKVDWI